MCTCTEDEKNETSITTCSVYIHYGCKYTYMNMYILLYVLCPAWRWSSPGGQSWGCSLRAVRWTPAVQPSPGWALAAAPGPVGWSGTEAVTRRPAYLWCAAWIQGDKTEYALTRDNGCTARSLYLRVYSVCTVMTPETMNRLKFACSWELKYIYTCSTMQWTVN